MPLDTARRVLEIEAQAIRDLIPRLGAAFASAVDLLFACTGRVVVTGMGKSGLIGQKISATLSSTGTPSLYLHPAEAIHGDLGRIVKGDAVIAISYSGETEEIVALTPTVRRLGSPLLAITGAPRSDLARPPTSTSTPPSARRPARSASPPPPPPPPPSPSATRWPWPCSSGAASPSTTSRCSTPGGRLGRKLLRVEDVMHTGDDVPRVTPETSMKDVLFEMTRKRLGMTTVVDGGRDAGGDDLGRRPAPPDGAPRLHAARPHRRAVDDDGRGGDRPASSSRPPASRSWRSAASPPCPWWTAAARAGGAASPRPLEDGDDLKDEALAARCRNLRLVLTDVDGVMTDGTILLLPGRRRGQGVPRPRRPGRRPRPARRAAGRHPLRPLVGHGRRGAPRSSASTSCARASRTRPPRCARSWPRRGSLPARWRTSATTSTTSR